MALITKNTIEVTPDAFSGQVAPVIPSLTAGEELPYASPVFIDTADGLVKKSVSTAKVDVVLTEAVDSDAGTVTMSRGKCLGFTPKKYLSGAKNVAIYGNGTILPNYASGMTAGTELYISATAGRLSDAPILAGDRPVAVAINATDIRVLVA